MKFLSSSETLNLHSDLRSLVPKVRHIIIKRIFDILFSILVLSVGFPIFFIIACAIRISSAGSIIYSHERIGRGGVPFHCYKFRSMYKDADLRLKKILANDEKLKKEWEENQKLKCDPRITPLGRFLRKTSLDEIPQFWNVLKGDLSVVGPRPVVRKELDLFYGQSVSKILSLRPGLTGIWQVSGRSNTSYETRVSLDELYVDKQSFLLDVKLICKTIPVMIFSKGAY